MVILFAFSVSLKMIQKFILFLFLVGSTSLLYCQEEPSRYRDKVFSHVTKQKNIVYSHRIPKGIKEKRYRLDLYRATQDTSLARPLIIWMHGGGFKFGSKKAKSIKIWSTDFARRGYVCAAINYRLSKNNPLKHFDVLLQSCYDAVQDVSRAIEFLKQHATVYRIDTSRIILAGNSAGAIIALQAAYGNNAEFMTLLKKADTAQTSLVDAASLSAVINFWGAMFDTSWLRNATVPIVSVHGKKDRVVPYRRSESLYGSYIIHQKADSLQIPNQLKTYDRYGHELQKHFIPVLRSGATKRRWRQAGKFAAEFLFAEVMR